MAISTRKRYSVIVMEENSHIVGWASINPYSHRCAYRGVGELSIYIKENIEERFGTEFTFSFRKNGQQNEFYKFVLFTFLLIILVKGYIVKWVIGK